MGINVINRIEALTELSMGTTMKPNSRPYQQLIERRKAEYGTKFDASDLAPQFIKYYENQERIEVEFPYGRERGRVGVTTGWKPVFLLMHRVSDSGSSSTLRENDVVVSVIPERNRRAA